MPWEQELISSRQNDDVEADMIANTEVDLMEFEIWWDERIMEKNEPKMKLECQVWGLGDCGHIMYKKLRNPTKTGKKEGDEQNLWNA